MAVFVRFICSSKQINLRISDIITKNNKTCLVLTHDDYDDEAIHEIVPVDEIFFGGVTKSINFESLITHIPNYIATSAWICQTAFGSYTTLGDERLAYFDIVNDKLYASIFMGSESFEIDMNKLYFCIWININKYKLVKYPVANVVSHRLIQHYILLREYFVIFGDVKQHMMLQFVNIVILN
jgi:hypothetical protein